MESVESLVKKYKKMGTNQVISQLGRVTGVAKEACLEVLRSRGQDVSEWEKVIEIPVKESEFRKVGSSSIFEASPEEELTPEEKKEIKQALKGMEEDPNSIKLRAEKETIKVTTKKAEKPSTPKKPKEEVTSLVEESQVYPDGSSVIFTDRSGAENVGVIKKFVWDKQDKMYYYVIAMENKKVTYKRPKNILGYAK